MYTLKTTASFTNYVPIIDEPGDFRVRFYDCDGTILKEQWVNQGEDATPPENPNYDPERLTFRGWNHSYTNIQGDTGVGALYTVNDHAIYYFFGFYQATSLSFQYINPNQAGTIDWGDGTTETLPIANSLTTISHSYTNAGNYIIKIDGVTNYVDKIVSSAASQWLIKSYIGNHYAHEGSNDCYNSNMAFYGPNFYVFDSDIKAFMSGINGPKLDIYIMNDNENTFNTTKSFYYMDGSNTRIIINDNCTSNIGTGSSTYMFQGSGDTFENLHQVVSISAGRPFYQAKYEYLNLKNIKTFLVDRNASIGSDNKCLKEIYFEEIERINQNSNFFISCPHLKNIILNTQNVVTKYDNSYLKSCNAQFNIYVPDSLYEDYINNASWSDEAFRIKKISELPETSHFYRYIKNS